MLRKYFGVNLSIFTNQFFLYSLMFQTINYFLTKKNSHFTENRKETILYSFKFDTLFKKIPIYNMFRNKFIIFLNPK